VPISTSGFKIYLLASDKKYMGAEVSYTGAAGVAVHRSQLLCPGKFVAAPYDSGWYIDVPLHITIKDVICL
jgi:hypothetical protein